MRFIPVLLTLSILFGQLDKFKDDQLTIKGKVYHNPGGYIQEIKECFIDVDGLDENMTFLSDSTGNFEFTLTVPSDFFYFDLAVYLNFAKELENGLLGKAHREIRPRISNDGVIDLGYVYLTTIDQTSLATRPTVWDLLEDSLLLMNLRSRELLDELNELNIRLAALGRQNEQYRQHIDDLELQSDNYYDRIIELEAKSNTYDQTSANLKAMLEREKNKKLLFDNLYVELYLDLIIQRDSVFALLDSSIYQAEDMMKQYSMIRGLREKYIQRQDLFAENSGMKDDDGYYYLLLATARDSLINSQDQIILDENRNRRYDEWYNSHSISRDKFIGLQDSLVISNLVIFNRYEVHEVVSGDHLWNIATHHPFYQNPYSWRVLYLFNKDQIADPDSIFPGQILKIPLPD